ncbi:phospholipase B1, membrane-associated [Diachasma alloeum]|uniref:phospholipase B1, membrane-associated n=1 Tax=Diachasma alloeum TaxID=454923 RepID=UPI0007383E0A|nr:phospholipase B1, membrane-associated [Diachasma alloeum]
MDHLKLLCIFILLAYPSVLYGQKTVLDSPENIQFLRNVKEFFVNVFGKTGTPGNPVFKEAVKMQHVQKQVSNETSFPCDVSGGRSEYVPTSVHKLRPGDIDIIGAMGDSLTAGFGIFATNLFNIFIENRGVSAIGGGQGTWRDFITLPNILKEYNPNLYGYSTEDSFTHQPESHFNVGENLAMSRDLPYMANNLVQRMKSDPRVDVEKHWKMITIFMGANDICSDICWTHPPSKAFVNHKNDLIETLRILRDNLPRTIISLLPLPNLMNVLEWKGRPAICNLFVQIGCSCLVGSPYRKQRAEFEQILIKWQQLDKEIPSYPEFQKEDFSVVAQTFMLQTNLPTVIPDGDVDLRYLSADCFHFSQRLNARVALGLWANLFEASKEKSTASFDESFFPCPRKENPYIATPGNS